MDKRVYTKDATLVSCGGNGWVRFWEISTGKLISEFQSHIQGTFFIMDKAITLLIMDFSNIYFFSISYIKHLI